MTQGQETAMGYAPPLAIAGIYEVCIGVPDPIFAIQYWEFLKVACPHTGFIGEKLFHGIVRVDSGENWGSWKDLSQRK